MCEKNINKPDLEEQNSNTSKIETNIKDNTKDSVNFLLNSTSIEKHISKIHNYILSWKYNDALILIDLIIKKTSLEKEKLIDIYIYKWNAELWLNKIDDCIKSYTIARDEGKYDISLMIYQFYINYSWTELTREEAFLKAQEELKKAIENNIIEAYSILWDIYNNSWDYVSADTLYLLWIEMWDIKSAKKFVEISEKELDYNNNHEINDFYKLFDYLIEEKWFFQLIVDLWDFKLKTWNPVAAYNSYKKYFSLTWDIEALKKQANVLEKNSNNFNLLDNIEENRKEIYKEIIILSSLRKDYVNNAYWLEKLADLQIIQWNKISAINNFKAIYALWKEARSLKIIEQWAYKLLKYLDESENELIIKIQSILMINDKKHLLTIWSNYEEKGKYEAALENYLIANEYNVDWANDCIVCLIYMYYNNLNPIKNIEDIISKLDNNKILNDEEKDFLRKYINFK